jgi:hypothetical protein
MRNGVLLLRLIEPSHPIVSRLLTATFVAQSQLVSAITKHATQLAMNSLEFANYEPKHFKVFRAIIAKGSITCTTHLTNCG